MKRVNKTILSLIIMLIATLSGNYDAYSQERISFDDFGTNKMYTIEVLESSVQRHSIRVTIHGLNDKQIVKNERVFHQLDFNEVSKLSFIGEPQLPTINQRIAIPENATIKASVKELKWRVIDMGDIYPNQKQTQESESDSAFIINDSIYQKEEYPIIRLIVGKEQMWNKIRNTTVSVCPFKYNPQMKRLSVLTEFEMEVCFSNTNSNSSIAPQSISMAKKWRLFDNEIGSFPVNEKEQTKDRSNTNSDNYDYLIIVGNNSSIMNSQAMSNFRKWKAFMGYKTNVVSTSVIGTTSSQIMSFIAQEKLKGISYVLFVGDYNSIPLKDYRILDDFSYIHTDSDYRYGCLDGDSDYVAELPIGRFSTNSLSDFTNMVNKTIEYETCFHGQCTKALLVAHKEGAPNNYQGCCESIASLYSGSLSFDKAYGASIYYNGNQATNSDVINYINNGAHIINYRGHGTPTTWGMNGNEWNYNGELFGAGQVGNLNTKAIYYNICCKTGNINYEPCLMETLTRSSSGAVACLAATSDVFNDPDDVYNRKLMNKLLSDGIWNIGYQNILAHIETINSYSLDDDKLKASFNAMSYLCGGDPSLRMWTSNPHEFNNITLTKSGGNISVYSSSFNSDGHISIVSETGDLINKYSISGNSCTFTYPSGNFYMVVNKHNYIPYIKYFVTSGYIQNESISNNISYSVSPLYIGRDVTTQKSFGDVIINNGAKLTIYNGTGGVTIPNGFECKSGGELSIE